MLWSALLLPEKAEGEESDHMQPWVVTCLGCEGGEGRLNRKLKRRKRERNKERESKMER